MDLYEYEGKELFARAGLTVPPSRLAHDVDEALKRAPEVGFPLAVKAQALTGGRGKAGGVKLVRNEKELRAAAEHILALTIKGKTVVALLLEAAVEIAHEYYLAITLDRAAKRPLLIFSTKGGMDIEQVARVDPGALRRVHIDPLIGLRDYQVRDLVLWAGFAGEQAKAFGKLVRTVWSLYCELDATLVELNPLCLTKDEGFVALDAKVTLDGNALYLHPQFDALRDCPDDRHRRATQAGLAYISLDGDIGVIGNGAGLVMSMIDLVTFAGGKPADFLDLHGGVKQERIEAALEILASDERVTAVLVSVFAAITRGDEVARGMIAALQRIGADLPVVVRLEGTHAEQGNRMLAEAALPNLFVASSITYAVRKALALSKSSTRKHNPAASNAASAAGSSDPDAREALTEV
jgi:succinyl-CoA synthetase beta subunit